MTSKLINFLIIFTSLLGFLEWGQGHRLFLFQAEAQIISKIFTNPVSVIHPLTMLPLVGQLMLLITLFQKKPNKLLTFIGIGGLGILLVLMFVIGIISLNLKIIFSTIPFLIVVVWAIIYYRKGNFKLKPNR